MNNKPTLPSSTHDINILNFVDDCNVFKDIFKDYESINLTPVETNDGKELEKNR